MIYMSCPPRISYYPRAPLDSHVLKNGPVVYQYDLPPPYCYFRKEKVEKGEYPQDDFLQRCHEDA